MISYIKGKVTNIEKIDNLTNNITICNNILGITCISSIFNEFILNEEVEIHLFYQFDIHSGNNKFYGFKNIEEKNIFLALKTNIDKIPTKISLVLSSFPKEKLENIFSLQIKINGLGPKIIEKVKDYFLQKEPEIRINYLVESNKKEEVKNLLLSLGGKNDLVDNFINKVDIKNLNNKEILTLFFN